MLCARMFYSFRQWLPLGIAVTALSGLAFALAQQSSRLGADDLPARAAEDAAYLLENGSGAANLVGMRAMELSRTLSPFVIVLNGTGGIVASSATLGGEAVAPRPDVLLRAQETGELRTTWEPRAGLRFAVVIRQFRGGYPGYVVVGQSLKDVDADVATLRNIALMGWGATMLLTFLATWLLVPRRRRYDSLPAREIPMMIAKEQVQPGIDRI